MTPTRRPRTAALAVLSTTLLVSGVLSGAEAASAAADTSFAQLSSDFTGGVDDAWLTGDISNPAGTLTLSPNTGAQGYTLLDLHGHALTVKAIQLTSNQAGSMTGSVLHIDDSVGGGSPASRPDR